jgi:hypothetical protein
MGGMNYKLPTAIKGTMKHAKRSFRPEIFAGAIISVVQYLVPLRYVLQNTASRLRQGRVTCAVMVSAARTCRHRHQGDV